MVSLLDERSLLLSFLLGIVLRHAFSDIFLLKLSALLFVMLVEEHIEVADEVVAFLTCRLRCAAVAPLDPGEHRLHDMNTTVVDDVRLHHAVAVGLKDLRKAPAEEVVTHVTEVQWLVRVRRRIFHHDERRVFRRGLLTIVRVTVDVVEQTEPCLGSDDEIEEATYGIEPGHSLTVVDKFLTDLLCRILRLLVRHLQEGEDDECDVTLETGLRLLQLYHLLRNVLTIELFHGSNSR